MNRSEPKKKMHHNRLFFEKSLYLLQHAYNPVDWYPWGEEAFQKAKQENKPIFLSIGYSTCHWCHVMAHESFEDTQVAQLLNNTFICIKVDREERPDIDHIYMTVCQLLTGRGGWPLTIIMTPEKKPFFAATYIPKENKFGQIGMLDLIPHIEKLWNTQRDKLETSAKTIINSMQQTILHKSQDELNKSTLDQTYNQLLTNYDEQHGGFSIAPKFPTPHNLYFLLRYCKRTKNKYALKMVETTLEQMRLGGIFDHVGYGFHRYSTDRKWLIPHFEKMLYDQALISIAYIEVFQATKKISYKKTSQEILEYILRDMTSPEGGFYSAEDADSEGIEGKFYTWQYKELEQILSEEELKIAIEVFNIKKEGNFTHEISQTKSGENILYQTQKLHELTAVIKIPSMDLERKLLTIRKKLYNYRKKRIHPQKDDKILTDWNGLMIAAFAKAAKVFENEKYLKASLKAANWIISTMMNSKGELLHRFRNGEARISGFADDYAFLTWGLIELYEATFDIKYLKYALELNDYMIKHFWDNKNGGFFFTSDKNESLLVRKKEIYDGAIPSANSVTMLNLLRLARLTGTFSYEEKTSQIRRAFFKIIHNNPINSTQLMVALDFAIGPSYEVVIVGNEQKKGTQDMIHSVQTNFLPNKVVLFKSTNEKNPKIEKITSYIKDHVSINNTATAYVCSDYTCKTPTTDIKKMLETMGLKNTKNKMNQ